MIQIQVLVRMFPINLFILFDIFDLVMGVLLCFFVKKENVKYLISALGIYWGAIFGGIIGAWINSENIYVIYLSVLAGVLIVVVIMKALENVHKFVLGMILGVKVVYMVGAMILKVMYSEHPDSVDETKCFIVAVFLGALCGICMTFLKEELENVNGGICAFIGATQIVGILAWDPRPIFLVSGEWNHFFLPLLKIIFYDDMVLCAGLIFLVAGIGFLVQIRRRKLKTT